MVLAFLAYVIGLSLAKACAVLAFFCQLSLSRSQADALLRQLAHHWQDEFDTLCHRIRNDRLHLLIFTDIGMAPETTMLAALRLAPAQCATWGHPTTSGLSTVDYFLSSEWMEPADAQQHYSERLVLFPGIGISVDKPAPPKALMPRRCEFESRPFLELPKPFLCAITSSCYATISST